MNNHYILMGDIIDSSSKEGGMLMENFKSIVKDVNDKHKSVIISPLTITLGDEFQGVIKDLNSAIDILFYLDKRILGNEVFYNMRYVINYGLIDTPINKENAYEMLGKGLTDARIRLNSLKKSHIKVHIDGVEDKLRMKLNSAFRLYQSIYDGIREKDRRLAYEFSEGADYKTLAKKFGKDDSSMWRKKQSLKIEDYLTSRKLIKMIADE